MAARIALKADTRTGKITRPPSVICPGFTSGSDRTGLNRCQPVPHDQTWWKEAIPPLIQLYALYIFTNFIPYNFLLSVLCQKIGGFLHS